MKEFRVCNIAYTLLIAHFGGIAGGLDACVASRIRIRELEGMSVSIYSDSWWGVGGL